MNKEQTNDCYVYLLVSGNPGKPGNLTIGAILALLHRRLPWPPKLKVTSIPEIIPETHHTLKQDISIENRGLEMPMVCQQFVCGRGLRFSSDVGGGWK